MWNTGMINLQWHLCPICNEWYIYDYSKVTKHACAFVVKNSIAYDKEVILSSDYKRYEEHEKK